MNFLLTIDRKLFVLTLRFVSILNLKFSGKDYFVAAMGGFLWFFGSLLLHDAAIGAMAFVYTLGLLWLVSLARLEHCNRHLAFFFCAFRLGLTIMTYINAIVYIQRFAWQHGLLIDALFILGLLCGPVSLYVNAHLEPAEITRSSS